MFALFTFVLIGFMALAVDGGFILAERRQVQSAADSAALAAVIAARDGGAWSASAQAYGSQNAGTNSLIVTSRPPASGPYAGDTNYIQVTISKPVTKFFVGVLYSGDWSVTATAIAGIESQGFNAGVLALNGDGGGISTAGGTRIRVNGGSIVSNYRITTSGDTVMSADEFVVADDGFVFSGSNTFSAMKEGPEVPDPLADKISPPTLPAFPSNPVPVVNPDVVACPAQHPGWWPVLPASDYYRNPGRFVNCNISIVGPLNGDYRFLSGNWRIEGTDPWNHGIFLPYQRVRLEGGDWNFVGGRGISVQETTHYFEMRAGRYSFLNGAMIRISGDAMNNIIGGGGTDSSSSSFYFSGGGGITAEGSVRVTLNPGTYIFDGGPGINMSGDSQLTFNPGTYIMFFRNGAGMRFSGSSRIVNVSGAHVKAHFYGSGNPSPVGYGCPVDTWSDMCMSGHTNMQIPSGEYYFDHGRFINSGSSVVTGTNVFFYFKNGGFLHSTGNATFGFTAPTSVIYPGYYPGVFMYSDPANTASFNWQGTVAATSVGVIYLPSSAIHFSGASNGVNFQGQLIAERITTSGATSLEVTYVEYVEMSVPQVFLVQ